MDCQFMNGTWCPYAIVDRIGDEEYQDGCELSGPYLDDRDGPEDCEAYLREEVD